MHWAESHCKICQTSEVARGISASLKTFLVVANLNNASFPCKHTTVLSFGDVSHSLTIEPWELGNTPSPMVTLNSNTKWHCHPRKKKTFGSVDDFAPLCCFPNLQETTIRPRHVQPNHVITTLATLHLPVKDFLHHRCPFQTPKLAPHLCCPLYETNFAMVCKT